MPRAQNSKKPILRKQTRRAISDSPSDSPANFDSTSITSSPKSLIDSSSPQGTYYQIKDIIDETSSQYLFDWEDDIVTGQSFSPTWQPKKYANSEAVAAWEQGKRERRLQQARPIISSSPSPSLSEIESSSRDVRQLDTYSSLQRDLNNENHPTVFLSQHSSFPRDEYELFQSSTSPSNGGTVQIPGSGPLSVNNNSTLRSIPITPPLHQTSQATIPDSQSSVFTASVELAMAATAAEGLPESQEQPQTPGQAQPNLGLVHERVAEIASQQNVAGPRSPSVIPEPPIINKPVGNSRLYPDDTGMGDDDFGEMPQLSTQASDDDSSQLISEENHATIILSELNPPKLGPREHIVILPLPGRLKDDYLRFLANSQEAVHQVLKSSETDSSANAEANKIFRALDNLCTHPDLNDTTAIAQVGNESDEDFRTWSESMSTKFTFLKSFCSVLRNENYNIILVCRQSTLIDYLRRFLAILRIRRQGPGPASLTRETFGCSGFLMVTIYCPDMETDSIQVPPANAIIALDSSYEADNVTLKACRSGVYPSSSKAPVIFPYVFASPEHIRLCSPKNIRREHMVRARMLFTVQTRKQCGDLDPEELGAAASGEEAAVWLQRGAVDTHWTLPPVRPLILKGVQLLSASPASQDTLATPMLSNGTPYPSSHTNGTGLSVSRSATPMSRKRTFEGVNIGTPLSPQKRARTEVRDGEVPKPEALLAVDKISTPAIGELRQAIVEEIQVETRSKIAELEEAFKKRTRLLELSIKDHQDSLNMLFTKYDVTKEQLRISLNTVESLEKKRQNFEDLLEREKSSNARLAEELRQCREERNDLAKMNAMLGTKATATADVSSTEPMEGDSSKDSSVKIEPSVYELRKENESLKKSTDSLKGELEFIRTQYQQRDSDLGTARRDIEDAQDENRQLVARLENIRAKEQGQAARAAVVENNMTFLKAQNRSLQAQLQKKEKDRGRGMATRSGSTAPRSPRFAGGSPVGSRIASRGGSPVRREGVAGRRGRTLQALE